jgi:superfamily II DNA/RNA helicase
MLKHLSTTLRYFAQRHIKDQPPLANGYGPIALIMAPTRELVAQISKVRQVA